MRGKSMSINGEDFPVMGDGFNKTGGLLKNVRNGIVSNVEKVRDKNELIIHVMHGYDSLKAPDGTDCFGCYIQGKYEIYVADDVPSDQLLHTIAHEYMHYLQDIEGREPDEEEANAFGFSVFTPCYQEGKKDIAKMAIEKFKAEKDREKPYSVTNMLWDRAIKILEELAKNI